MRHGKKVNHLGRTSSHRNAMLSNMASSLIMHKRISTTVAKAKALRKYIEPLITRSKDDSTHSRRMVFSYLQDKVAVTELFRDISQKIGDRPGGYTRILRTGFRVGDAAEMCLIELVDYNDNYTQNKGGKRAKAKSTRRGGGRTRKKEETPDAINVETTVKEEVPVIEEASATVEAEIVEETPAVEEVVEETPIAEEVPVVEETAEPEIVAETPIAEEIPVVEEVVEETPIAEETPVVEEVVEETPIAEETPAVEETAEPEIVAETPIAEEEK